MSIGGKKRVGTWSWGHLPHYVQRRADATYSILQNEQFYQSGAVPKLRPSRRAVIMALQAERRTIRSSFTHWETESLDLNEWPGAAERMRCLNRAIQCVLYLR